MPSWRSTRTASSSPCAPGRSPISAPITPPIAPPGRRCRNLGSLAGTYTTPALHAEVQGVMTHTMLTGHYRGAGRPEASYIIETMVDLAARQLGIDPVELRRRNTIPPIATPYKTGLAFTFDSGDFGKNLADGAAARRLCRLSARAARKSKQARQAARHRRHQHGRGHGRRTCSNTPRCASIRPAR